jgi:hypothetical protein
MSEILNTQLQDPCCSKPFSKASLSGALDDLNYWLCPKCGTEWKPRKIGTIRHWEPVTFAAILR